MKTTLDITQILDNFRADQDVMISTKNQYYNVMCLFYRWIELSGNDWQALGVRHIINFKERLFQDNKSIGTIRSYVVIIKIFFKWAQQNGLCENIASGIKLPKGGDGFNRKPLNEYQAKKFLNQINTQTTVGKRNYAMFYLMFVSGLRSDSIHGMDISDLQNYEGHDVIWYRIKGSHGQKNYFKPLTQRTIDAIETYLLTRANMQDHWPLFATHSRSIRGTRLSQRSMRSIFKKQLAHIGINDRRITLHSIRHTHGMIAIKATSAYEVQLSLNHKSSATSRIYNKHADEDIILQNRTANAIESEL